MIEADAHASLIASLDGFSSAVSVVDARVRDMAARERPKRRTLTGTLVMPGNNTAVIGVDLGSPGQGYRWLVRLLGITPVTFNPPAVPTIAAGVSFGVGAFSAGVTQLGTQNLKAYLTVGQMLNAAASSYVDPSQYRYFSNEQIEVHPGDHLYAIGQGLGNATGGTLSVVADVLIVSTVVLRGGEVER